MAASQFWQALSDTIERSVNLRVVTMVGDAQISGSLEQMKVLAPEKPSATLVTDINLVGGDITNILSEGLLGPDRADLRSEHAAAVKQAQEIVARNVGILVSIAKEIGSQLGNLPEPSTKGPIRQP